MQVGWNWNEFIISEYGQLAVTCEENDNLRGVHIAGHILTSLLAIS